MATIKMQEHEEYPVLPDDSIIHVTVTQCTVKTVDHPTRPWEKLEITFKIDGIQAAGDGGDTDRFSGLIGSNIWGSVPFRFTDSPDNRLKQWVEAIIGMELTVGFELDTDLLEGRKVRAVTTTYAKKTVDPRTGQPFRNHQVAHLLPVGSNGLASAVAAPAWETDEAPF